MNCTVCGNPLPEGAAFCTVCGAPVPKAPTDTILCPSCGKVLPAKVAFCTGCGTRIRPAAAATIVEAPLTEKTAPATVCIACGAPLWDGSTFCTVCGASQTFTPELMRAAKAGDQSALTELYNRTYNGIYYALLTFLKDPDTAQDILQDSYIKAFAHLDSLQDTNRFAGWLKMIALNQARDFLRKKKPMLFSEMAGDDGDQSDPDVVEVNNGYQPEEALDAQEKKRLLWEIINSLSDEQRMIVSLFYFQEMSLNEIAEELGLPLGTVKSRLNYGRKKIEGKVLELERQGTKLYGMAPMAFLLWLLGQNQMVLPAVPPLAVGAAGAAAGTAAATAAGTTAGGATVLGMSEGTAAGGATVLGMSEGTAAGGATGATVLGMSAGTAGTASATVLGMTGAATAAGAAGATVIGMTTAATAGTAAAAGGMAVGAKIGIAALAIAVAAGGTTAGVVVAHNAGIGPWASSATSVEEAAESTVPNSTPASSAPAEEPAAPAEDAKPLEDMISVITVSNAAGSSFFTQDESFAFFFNDAGQVTQATGLFPNQQDHPLNFYYSYRDDGSLVYGRGGGPGATGMYLVSGEGGIPQKLYYPTQDLAYCTIFDENGIPAGMWLASPEDVDAGQPNYMPADSFWAGSMPDGLVYPFTYTYDNQGLLIGGSCTLENYQGTNTVDFTCGYYNPSPAQTIEELNADRGVVDPDTYDAFDLSTNTDKYIGTSGGVTVRSGPAEDTAALDSLALDSLVSIRGHSNAASGWVYVAYVVEDENRFGWIPDENLNDGDSAWMAMYGN